MSIFGHTNKLAFTYYAAILSIKNKGMNMRTTLDIDDTLLETVMKLTSASSKKDAIETALREFLRARRREELSQLIGHYDHFGLSLKALKKMRRDD